jgi:Flp pilus assembly protein TadD
MSHFVRQSINFRRTSPRALPVLASITVSLLLGACASGSSNPLLATPDPLLQKPTAVELALNPNAELHKATEYWGKQHAENPRDPRAAVNYVRNLKAMGSKKEALTIIQEAHRFNTTDREINSEYGRLALEHDQLSVAQKLLEHADDPIKPDWRVISARGTVLAKQNKNAEAIPFFQRAHDIAPEQSSVLNNLAMAHAMNGQADKAETMLRDAAIKNSGDPRIAHNLALVLGLQGKHEEAKTVAEVSLPSDATRHNADVVRQMLQNDQSPEPIAAMPLAKTAAASGTSRKSTASIAKPITTGTVAPAAKSKNKDKAAAVADVDANELVRRLADGDAASAPAKTK